MSALTTMRAIPHRLLRALVALIAFAPCAAALAKAATCAGYLFR